MMREGAGGGGLLTWQSVEIMATATVADGR